jgi:hypothetical protein
MDLIRKIYKKRPWFRIIREPLILGMKILSAINGIKREEHARGHPECDGCVRFMKAELEMRSWTFRFVNKLIGPWFRNIRDKGLNDEDFQNAKKKAADMMEILKGMDDDKKDADKRRVSFRSGWRNRETRGDKGGRYGFRD